MGTGLYRLAVLLLWALALLNSAASRGLYWDGGSFFVDIIDTGGFHDSFVSRAHVAWATQLPLLAALDLGITDNTRVLAIVLSAGLFFLPAALYHLALARLRHDATSLAIAIAVVAIVYLPTSFFIIGEYNVTYAAVAAAMAVALTFKSRRDGVILCLLGVLCLRSYESMVYFGPLLAAASLWGAPDDDDIARLLRRLAAFAFLGGAVVALRTMVYYWDHPYFIEVRAATFDFWQDLQFVIPIVGLAIFAAITLLTPRWLQGRGPTIVIGVVAILLVVSPWAYLVNPGTILFPPAHYVARTAAGGVLLALLAALWLYRAWRGPPLALVDTLRQPEVGRRLTMAMLLLFAASAVPDVFLTRVWTDYVSLRRGYVTSHTGYIKASTLPSLAWPHRMFDQNWTLPALSVILRAKPGDAVIVDDMDARMNQPFDPACGTVPKLASYNWR
ncbi:MAG TPA: hypothetical protein VMI56_06635 [Reyranella sp.]|nr:hypothetical protein [Reyranella sp.]